jgi:hypothetical protein
MTIGPSATFNGNPEYEVSGFGVNTNCFGLPSSSPKTLFSTVPPRRLPFQAAMIDTLG